MRRWRKRRRRLRRRLRRAGDLALVGLVVVAIVFAVHRRHTSPHTATSTTAKPGSLDAVHPPAADVVIQVCQYVNFAVYSRVLVHNHTSETVSYYVDVVFKNGGRMYAQAVARSKPVAGSAEAAIAAYLPSRGAPPKHLTCVIGSIERFAGAPPTSAPR